MFVGWCQHYCYHDLRIVVDPFHFMCIVCYKYKYLLNKFKISWRLYVLQVAKTLYLYGYYTYRMAAVGGYESIVIMLFRLQV